MPKFSHVFSTALFVLSFSSLPAVAAEQSQQTLTIEADEWCPINCNPSASQLGIGIDLAKKIFEPLGYRINYVVVPWTRALEDVRSGKADAVVGASRSDDARLVFPDNAITNISDDFYILKGSPWQYQGEFTLKDKHVGVIDGYGYGEVVTKYINAHKNIPGEIFISQGKDALNQNIEALINRKIDLIIESKVVMDYHLQKMNLDDKLVWAGGVPQAPVYVAFSPKLVQSARLKAQYDAGIRQLQASGALAGMYSSYQLRP